LRQVLMYFQPIIIMKTILIILDGLGGLPTKSEKTALESAKTPSMNSLVNEGMCGLLSTLGRGVVPGSDTAHLQIFGYDPKTYYHGRGPFEALGAGMSLQHGDIAFRANFGTVKDGIIVDRRAGRIPTYDARKLERHCSMTIKGVRFIFKHTVEHRGVLVIRGFKGKPPTPKTLHTLTTDPHKTGVKPILSNSIKLQKLIREYSLKVSKLLSSDSENKKRKLPANFILIRGAGLHHTVPSISKRFGISSACIAGGALYRGVAKYVGMDIVNVPEATGDKHTNLNAILNASITALKTHDFVFTHIKATDSFGHDGDFEGKKRMIEKVDKYIISKLKDRKINIIVTGDHSTPCVRKEHSGHPVPILIREIGGRVDTVTSFGERACMKGGLGHINGSDIMNIILNISEKAKKYGS